MNDKKNRVVEFYFSPYFQGVFVADAQCSQNSSRFFSSTFRKLRFDIAPGVENREGTKKKKRSLHFLFSEVGMGVLVN